MPELENPEAKRSDPALSILAGYLTPKDLAQALGVSERTVARWHHFREGPPRVEIGRKVFYRLESVTAWVASCERPEPRSGRARRPRSRAIDSSRLTVSTERNDLSSLSGSSGGND
jgi:predicted DNA-binding transcriptional regulator AlpA